MLSLFLDGYKWKKRKIWDKFGYLLVFILITFIYTDNEE